MNEPEPRRVEAFGPKDAKIVIVGEAPGETEERYGVPFCGSSGDELRKMMEEVGIDKSQCRLTNVFKQRPPDNKLEAWTVAKKELPSDYGLEPLSLGHYLRPDFVHYVDELHSELEGYSPNLILVAGGTATWALGISGGISRTRGVVVQTRWGKALPIYHPAAVLRQWSLRTITLSDLHKAKYESQFPEVRRPERELWIEPTISEVCEFFAKYLDPATSVALDIENPGGVLACISLAPSEKLGICIPFTDPRKPGNSYWSLEDERVVWRLLWHLLITRVRQRTIRTIGQNLLYDVQVLARDAKFMIPRIDDDTMLSHHALFPEMLKGLGFLGSVYTNELSWKQMVKDLGRDK